MYVSVKHVYYSLKINILNFKSGARKKSILFYFRREKLAVAIENENYIKKLLKIFHMCEVCIIVYLLEHFILSVFFNYFIKRMVTNKRKVQCTIYNKYQCCGLWIHCILIWIWIRFPRILFVK